MKDMTPRQINKAVADIQSIIDIKKEQLSAETSKLKKALLKGQIEGRERAIQRLLDSQNQSK